MSEATEVTEIVERVREHLAAAVGIGHPDEKGYIDFLTEILAALTAATERAEWAEARRHVWEQRARMVVRERRALRVECEALRKDAARYRWLRDNKEREVAVCDIDVCYYLDGLDAYIDAALAVQP